MAQLVLTDSQDCSLSVVILDKKGFPAAVQSPVWTGSDDAIATVVVDAADALKANISSVAPGTMLVTFTADSDLGDGVTAIIGTMDVVVGSGTATVIEIQSGTPTEQP